MKCADGSHGQLDRLIELKGFVISYDRILVLPSDC